MQFELTRELIEQAFDLLGEYASQQGIVIEIAVYGGSCLMLASDIRNASGDVDAVFLSNRSQISSLSRRVASQLGMPDNWLNEGVRRLARRSQFVVATDFFLFDRPSKIPIDDGGFQQPQPTHLTQRL